MFSAVVGDGGLVGGGCSVVQYFVVRRSNVPSTSPLSTMGGAIPGTSRTLMLPRAPCTYHAHRESEEFFRFTGQLAQPNQDTVFSKRAAFFNGLKSKVRRIMAKATALRVNLNLAPSIPSAPRAPARSSNAQLLYALNLSTMSFPPMAHERTGRTLLKVVAFASRSFSTFFTIFFRPSPTP